MLFLVPPALSAATATEPTEAEAPLPHFSPGEALAHYGRYVADRFTAMALRADESAYPYSLPKISMHEHYRVGGNIDALLAVMDELNIRKMILVPTGSPPDNGKYREHMAALLDIQRRHPDRIVAFATVDESDPEAPRILRQAIADGAKGLKLIGGHPDFYDAPLDSALMHELMAVCRDAGLPVLIHVSMAAYPEMQEQFERLVADFPEVTFIAAHYCKHAPRLGPARELLDRHPNLYTDLSMGGGVSRYLRQIDADPQQFRRFVMDYQDRVMWGSDIILDEGKGESFVRSRVSEDLHLFRRRIHASRWADYEVPLHGLELPEQVLRKIYWDNPWRILGERVLGSRAEAEAAAAGFGAPAGEGGQ
ncbi:MAG: amidohydrolase [Armatimonadota bacterium]|nr:MAG: amidohydrolase [Armatimonadota bacterium]